MVLAVAFFPSPNPLLSPPSSLPFPFNHPPKRSRHGHPFRDLASSNPGSPFGLPRQRLSRSFPRGSGRLWLSPGVAEKKETGFSFCVSASNPSSTSPTPTGEGSDEYDVFLSFRGSDTRKEFTDHLYHSLVNAGIVQIHVFRDENNISIGEKFGSQILDAISRSKISIPIISENYASSKWCLRELIHIMYHKKSKSQVVLPIFYKVAPSDVRYLKGNFGKAFYSRQERFDKEDVEKGQQALEEVSYLNGWESEKIANGHEGELIKLVVKTVLSELRKHFQLDVPKQLVGLDGHLLGIMNWIDIPSVHARMIGIYGMGGIGKTTLAKYIYNELSRRFVHASFLPDIRETTRRHGIEYLQSQLISDIVQSTIEVSRYDDGINIIISRFKGKKVLILLDDIDHKDQLNALARERSWFASGSIIIVTTRNKSVLDQSEFEVDNKYELNEIDKEYSLLLFSRHAFRADRPPREFRDISHNIISTVGGLPLALEVIGSYLYGKADRKVWEDMLRKLNKEPHRDVEEILKISYEALENPHKEIFLDVACFLIGKESKFAIYMWEDYGFYASLGVEELKLRCLIRIDDDGKLRMHDQLRDLGRNIVQKEGSPERRSRLWLYEEAYEVLTGKKGTKMIQAICLQKDGRQLHTYTNKQFKDLRRLRYLQLGRVALSGDFNKLFSEVRWLHCFGIEEKKRWTILNKGSSSATNLYLPKLLVLQLSNMDITEHWGRWSSIMAAEQVKVLDLSNCTLKSTPDLSAFTKLEILILKDCYRLEQLHPSIGKLKSLISLDLTGCRNLKELPEEVGKLEELKELILDGASIKKFPTSIGSLRKLEKLSAYDCWFLREISSSIGSLSSLQHLTLWSGSGIEDERLESWARSLSKSLEEIPSSIGNLSSLQRLHLNCWSLREIPSSIGNLSSLQHLDISGCKYLRELPSSIGNLSSLQHLYLKDCRLLRELPNSIENLSSLKRLDLRGCRSLGEIPSSIGNLSSLQYLDLRGCQLLKEFPSSSWNLSLLQHLNLGDCGSLNEISIGNFSSLQQLNLSGCAHLKEIPSSIGNLQNLQHLDISYSSIEKLPNACRSLGEIPSSIGNLSSLQYLDLRGCQLLKEFPSSSWNLSLLQHLNLGDCGSLNEISIGNFSSLQQLNLSGCAHLKEIPSSIGNLQNLQHLDISYSSIEKLPNAIGRLKKLQSLILIGCRSLKRKVPSEIGDLSSLEILEITWAPIYNLPKSIQNLSSLQHLNLLYCNKLLWLPELPSGLTHLMVSCHSPSLPPLSCLINLEELYLDGCDLLESIPKLPSRPLKLNVKSCHKLMPKLDGLEYLEELSIKHCGSIKRLDLSKLNRLKRLHIEDCDNLVEIQGHDNLESLEKISICCCRSLQRVILPELHCLKQLEVKFCDNLVGVQGHDGDKFIEGFGFL